MVLLLKDLVLLGVVVEFFVLGDRRRLAEVQPGDRDLSLILRPKDPERLRGISKLPDDPLRLFQRDRCAVVLHDLQWVRCPDPLPDQTQKV